MWEWPGRKDKDLCDYVSFSDLIKYFAAWWFVRTFHVLSRGQKTFIWLLLINNQTAFILIYLITCCCHTKDHWYLPFEFRKSKLGLCLQFYIHLSNIISVFTEGFIKWIIYWVTIRIIMQAQSTHMFSCHLCLKMVMPLVVLLFEWMHLEDEVAGNKDVSLLQDDLSWAVASLL